MAFFEACSFQSAFTVSTAYSASAAVMPESSNILMSRVREYGPESRQILVSPTAFFCVSVPAGVSAAAGAGGTLAGLVAGVHPVPSHQRDRPESETSGYQPAGMGAGGSSDMTFSFVPLRYPVTVSETSSPRWQLGR